MVDLEPIINQVRAWERRMTDDKGAPGILRARAYVRRRWPELDFEAREEVLAAVNQTRRVGAAVLPFQAVR